MLALTQTAIDAIKTVAPGDAGLRVCLIGGTLTIESLQLDVAAAARPGDQVLEEHGARVFVEPRAAAALDGMVLGAVRERGRIRFVIAQRPGS